MELLKRLEVLKVGLNEVEAFCSGLNIKFRSKAFRDKGAKATRGVAAVVMKTKISDEVSKLGELTRERDNIRRDLKSVPHCGRGREIRECRRLQLEPNLEKATKKD